MEYSSALKNKEILTHATTWMNLEGIILNEACQPQKDSYYKILLIWSVFKQKGGGQELEDSKWKTITHLAG